MKRLKIKKIIRNNEFINIINEINICLEHYSIPLKENKVVVGFSGGKDSVVLSIVLSLSGFNVIPVYVDIIHDNNYHKYINGLFSEFNIFPVIINITDNDPKNYYSLVEMHYKKMLKKDSIPCTHCSQIRRILLNQYAIENNIQYVCYAHHFNDFAVTILKDYFIEQYYKTVGYYIEEQFVFFVHNHHIDIDFLKELVLKKRASTMGIKNKMKSKIMLIRPMFNVEELSIINLIKLLGIQIKSKRCALLNESSIKMSKRDIVYEYVKDRFMQNQLFKKEICKIMLESLTFDGFVKFNPRGNRHLNLPHLEKGLN